MTKTKLLKSAGRFGARYGQSVKRRIAEIEARQRKRQTCSFCKGPAKRISKGIWKCRKCKMKFTGPAYYLEQTAGAVPAMPSPGFAKPLKTEKPKALKKKKPAIVKEEK